MTIATTCRRLASAALLLASSAVPAAAEDSPPSKYPYDIINAATARSVVTATTLRGPVKLVDGAGGNIVALVGDDGMLLVDTGIAVARDRIAAALGGFDGQRLRYVVNTHWHWDHTDGNGWARQLGAVILAAPNTTRHLSETIRVEEWGHTFEPVDAADRPSEAVTAERTLHLDGLARIRWCSSTASMWLGSRRPVRRTQWLLQTSTSSATGWRCPACWAIAIRCASTWCCSSSSRWWRNCTTTSPASIAIESADWRRYWHARSGSKKTSAF